MKDKEINFSKKTPLSEPKTLCREARNLSVYVGEKDSELISTFKVRTDRGIAPWCWEMRFLANISGDCGDRSGFRASERLPLGSIGD